MNNKEATATEETRCLEAPRHRLDEIGLLR